MSVGTPKYGWASEMQCLGLVGLHPPRGELGLHWVADDKHPPGEGSQHFEPWQKVFCSLRHPEKVEAVLALGVRTLHLEALWVVPEVVPGADLTT